MIRIDSLTKNFGNQLLFDNLRLTIPLNKTTVLAGPSGSGKTTLLRIIAGLDKDYQGTVSGVPESISFLFQEDRLLPWRNARGNIEFVLKDAMDKEAMDSAVFNMISSVQLTGHEDKTPSKLSGGMKRRAAMARAYCYPSELLLLDEPFEGFDLKLKNDMTELFENLYFRSNKTVILVTHDISIVKKLGCDVIDISRI